MHLSAHLGLMGLSWHDVLFVLFFGRKPEIHLLDLRAPPWASPRFLALRFCEFEKGRPVLMEILGVPSPIFPRIRLCIKPPKKPRENGRLRNQPLERWVNLILRRYQKAHGCGSKPMGSHFGVGAPPILEPIVVGIGMFTGATIWLLTE